MLPLLLLLAAAQPDHGTRVNVGVFQFSGPVGAELREQARFALEETFGVRTFALDHAAVLERTGCEALDQACLRRLGGWLSRDASTAVDALTQDELVQEAPAIVGCQTASALAHRAA